MSAAEVVRPEPGAIQLGGMGGDAEVVAAQSDRHVDGPQLVLHLVVVPDQRLAWRHWSSVKACWSLPTVFSVVTVAGGRSAPRSWP